MAIRDLAARVRSRALARTLLQHARPSKSTLVWASVLLSVQAYLVLTYVSITNRPGGVDLFVIVPWIWIDVAIWAFVRTSPNAVVGRERLVAAGIAGGYFALVLLISGVVGLGTAFADGLPATAPRLVLFEAPPGWAPTLLYAGEYVRVALRPPLLLGYGAIAYLLYATITEVRGALVGGFVGLFSCVGCVVPVVAAVAGALVGGTSGILNPGTVAAVSGYGVSTVVFLVTIALLYAGHVLAGAR